MSSYVAYIQGDFSNKSNMSGSNECGTAAEEYVSFGIGGSFLSSPRTKDISKKPTQFDKIINSRQNYKFLFANIE